MWSCCRNCSIFLIIKGSSCDLVLCSGTKLEAVCQKLGTPGQEPKHNILLWPRYTTWNVIILSMACFNMLQFLLVNSTQFHGCPLWDYAFLTANTCTDIPFNFYKSIFFQNVSIQTAFTNLQNKIMLKDYAIIK
jgi:hypothetical protein